MIYETSLIRTFFNQLNNNQIASKMNDFLHRMKAYLAQEMAYQPIEGYNSELITGWYQLAISKRYSVGAILKEPRTAVYAKTLTECTKTLLTRFSKVNRMLSAIKNISISIGNIFKWNRIAYIL